MSLARCRSMGWRGLGASGVGVVGPSVGDSTGGLASTRCRSGRRCRRTWATDGHVGVDESGCPPGCPRWHRCYRTRRPRRSNVLLQRRRCDLVPPGVPIGDREAGDPACHLHGVVRWDGGALCASGVGVVGPSVGDSAGGLASTRCRSGRRCRRTWATDGHVGVDEWGAHQAARGGTVVIERVGRGVVRVAPRRRCDLVPPGVPIGDRGSR